MRYRSIAGARNAMQCRASHPTNLLQAFRPLPLLTIRLRFARSPYGEVCHASSAWVRSQAMSIC